MWQVRPLVLDEPDELSVETIREGMAEDAMAYWRDTIVANHLQPASRGRMAARVNDAHSRQAGARFRGMENHLYRVEVHMGGDASEATFKWSRVNGMAALPLEDLTSPGEAEAGDTTVFQLKTVPRDERLALHVGDWVELADDYAVLLRSRVTPEKVDPLFQVRDVDYDLMTITLEGSPRSGINQRPQLHPLVRRWDHRATENVTLRDGAVPLREGTWLPLEDGVEVYFQAGHTYRAGDYWLIPARAATQNILWEAEEPVAPQGVAHHYAPLALLDADGELTDLRRLLQLCPPEREGAAPEPPEPGERPPSEEVTELRRTVEEMRERLAEMQEVVNELQEHLG